MNALVTHLHQRVSPVVVTIVAAAVGQQFARAEVSTPIFHLCLLLLLYLFSSLSYIFTSSTMPFFSFSLSQISQYADTHIGKIIHNM